MTLLEGPVEDASGLTPGGRGKGILVRSNCTSLSAVCGQARWGMQASWEPVSPTFSGRCVVGHVWGEHEGGQAGEAQSASPRELGPHPEGSQKPQQVSSGAVAERLVCYVEGGVLGKGEAERPVRKLLPCPVQRCCSRGA